MWTIIDTLYASNLGFEVEANVLTIASNVLRIEQQFFNWQSTLEPDLSLVQPQDISGATYSLSKKLRVILTLRYHNLRILAYRPYVDLYLRYIEKGYADEEERLMLAQFGGSNMKASLDSATSLIKIVHLITTSGTSTRRLLGAWWFTLYYSIVARCHCYAPW